MLDMGEFPSDAELLGVTDPDLIRERNRASDIASSEPGKWAEELSRMTA